MQLISIYLQDMLPYVCIGFIIYILIRSVYVKKMKKEIEWLREIWLSIFVVYMIALLSQTIIPSFTFGRDDLTGEVFFWVNKENTNASVNLIPFNTIYEFLSCNDKVDSWGQVSILNLMANLFLFMPFGFLLPELWRRFESLKSMILYGLIFTFSIEFVQFFIGRSSDIDDIILNLISIIIGYGGFIVCKKSFLFMNVKANTKSNL